MQLLSSSSPAVKQKEKGEDKKTEKKFGIVSTGMQWAEILSEAICADVGNGVGMGKEAAERWFAGVECVGVDAGDLHPQPSKEQEVEVEEGGGGGSIRQSIQQATGRLLDRGDIGVIILGCAGMVGMELWVRVF